MKNDFQIGDAVRRVYGSQSKQRGVIQGVDGLFVFAFGRWFHFQTLVKV